MARAVWSGSISFGLVSIPVRLYPAVTSRTPRFHMIDRETGKRVRFRRVVEESAPSPEGPRSQTRAPSELPAPEPQRAEAAWEPEAPEPATREVRYEDLARGYEVAPGEQVVVEAEELEALRPEPSREIEIEHFVALAEIDPVYFEKSYQVAPSDEFALKPYTLLREAMERSGRVAVGRFVLRTREHLAVIRPTRGILGLETMYFADEVREVAAEGSRGSQTEVTEPEVDMAGRFIEALSADWDPGRYDDPYRERVLELIRARQPMEMPLEEEAARRSPPVADLMAALKASVEAAKEASNASSGGESRRRQGGKRAEGR